MSQLRVPARPERWVILGQWAPCREDCPPHLCCISSWGQRPWKEEQCEAWWAERAALSFPSESSQLCRPVEEGRWSQ